MEKGQLAKRIRAFRKLKGMTQTDLANHLNISISIIGAIERGHRQPDDKLLEAIAQALRVDVEEILNVKAGERES